MPPTRWTTTRTVREVGFAESHFRPGGPTRSLECGSLKVRWGQCWQRIESKVGKPFIVTMYRGKGAELAALSEVWADAYSALSQAKRVEIVGFSSRLIDPGDKDASPCRVNQGTADRGDEDRAEPGSGRARQSPTSTCCTRLSPTVIRPFDVLRPRCRAGRGTGHSGLGAHGAADSAAPCDLRLHHNGSAPGAVPGSPRHRGPLPRPFTVPDPGPGPCDLRI